MGCGLSCRNCTVQVSKLFYIIARWRALRRLTVSGTSCCLWLALTVVCGVVSSNATKVSLIVFVCHQCYWKIFKLSSWKFHSRQQCLWDHAMIDSSVSGIMPWLTAVALGSCHDWQQWLWDHAIIDSSGSGVMPWLTAVSLGSCRDWQQCLWGHAMIDSSGSGIMPWLTTVSLGLCHDWQPCLWDHAMIDSSVSQFFPEIMLWSSLPRASTLCYAHVNTCWFAKNAERLQSKWVVTMDCR